MEALDGAALAASGRVALSSALLDQARRSLSAGDSLAARTSLATAVTLDPTPASRYAYAAALSDAGDSDAAIRQLDQAWEHARRVASPVWRARCCHALAELHRAAGRIDVANRYRQWAIRAELDGDSAVNVAVWLHDRGAEALLRGDPDDASALFGSAACIARDDLPESARLLSSQGVVAIREGRWAQGLRWLVRAFHAFRRLEEFGGCAAAVANIGHILQARGEWIRAAACFRHAARLFLYVGGSEHASRCRRWCRECERLHLALTGDPACN